MDTKQMDEVVAELKARHSQRFGRVPRFRWKIKKKTIQNMPISLFKPGQLWYKAIDKMR